MGESMSIRSEIPENASPDEDMFENQSMDSIQDLNDTIELAAASGGCACIFDIDCTLSSRSHGSVHLASMGHYFRGSFCGRCHIGAITVGSYRNIPGIHHEVSNCYGGCKAHAAAGMARSFGVPRSHVYFFDDNSHNVGSFHGSG